MRFKNYLLIFFICFSSIAYSQKKKDSAVPRPKLVVGLVVDQMRWDYLYRYYDRYSDDGFKRLLREGFSCENTYIPYIPAFTAIGHSSIYTGSVPALHGITGNEWVEQSNGYKMYCTEDSSVKSVGTTSAAGQMSPKNLQASTVTDELKLATNFRSKVIGISLKDRGGILPAGHAANAAYWYDDLTGNWISSTFYMTDLPVWVKKFNDARPVEKYLNQKWNTLYPIETYKQSSADNSSRYEGNASTFPHDFSGKGKNFSAIRSNPFGNTLTLDFAKAALENEALGKGEVTDFLAVSLSSTDYLGHQYGPNAIELEDAYLRLDKDLASFLDYLDKAVGKGQYTFFISADHGAAHNPVFLQDNKLPGGFFPGSTGISVGLKELNSMLSKKYKSNNIVRTIANYQVHFDYKVIEEKGLNIDEIKKDVIDFYSKLPGISYAVDLKNIDRSPLPEVLKARIIHGYNQKRSGEVQLVMNPGWYNGNSAKQTGASHGTWNPYDTHIPLIFSGWGIKQGISHHQYFMTDIASTIAALLKIQEPNGNIGKPIVEALK